MLEDEVNNDTDLFGDSTPDEEEPTMILDDAEGEPTMILDEEPVVESDTSMESGASISQEEITAMMNPAGSAGSAQENEPTMEESNLFDDAGGSNTQTKKQPNIKLASFEEITDDSPEGESRSLEFLMDVALNVSVRLGSTKIMIRDLLQLTHGSVVELDKLAGEPMDVLINDKLIARGEVVVVNEKFGVRLTDIISHVDRIKSLK